MAARQIPLFRDDDDEYPPSLYGGRPPSEPTDTSIDAARSMAQQAQTLRAEVLATIAVAGARGCTDEELQMTLHMEGNTERPRRRELVLLGQIYDSHRVRRTLSGRQASVWVSRPEWVTPLP